jgi:FkbM family methyltransferase
MHILNRSVSWAARRIGAWPLAAIGAHFRAEVLENLTEEAITVTTTPGGKIRFHTPTPLLISRATSVLSKETDTIHWIDGFERGSVFWDVGANVGVYSFYAAIVKGASVLAFEPSAANCYVLSRNIQLNQLSKQVTAYCLAFSEHTQLGVLNMSSARMGAAISQFGEVTEMSPYWEGGPGVAEQGMIGFSIDDFIDQFAPRFPNHLKLDVDGLEVSILDGAQKTIRDPRLRSLLVELNVSQESEYRNALHFLEDAGFRFVSRGVTQGTQTEPASNHIFQRVTDINNASD